MPKKIVRQLLHRAIGSVSFDLRRDYLVDDMLMVQSAAASMHIRALHEPRSLHDVELRVFSQWGEDGIIAWLVAHLPGIPTSFVEFGVEDYVESNTRYLLQTRNWRGLILDASTAHVATIRARRESWRHDLRADSLFITADNIDGALRDGGFSGDIGLLSIDIDGNDYWILEAMTVASPWILVCEYNALFGDKHAVSVPYVSDFTRFSTHPSGLFFGASLPAFEHLAAAKGYTLVGSNSAGTNAFFVRNDVVKMLNGFPSDRRGSPSRLREGRDSGGAFTLASGSARVKAIDSLEVIDVRSKSRRALASLGALYSDAWLREMDGEGG